MLATLLISVLVWMTPLQLALQSNSGGIEELSPVTQEEEKPAEAKQQPASENAASSTSDAASTPSDAESNEAKPTNTGQEGLRRPFQDDILKSLLSDREASQTIPRQDPGMPAQPPALIGGQREVAGLMPDGTPIVERPGRFYRNGEQKLIELRLPSGERRISLEVLPNALLEALEREAAMGVAEFTVSGELTRYGGQNYLLLRKVVQRVDNGNLAP